jgi:hypothetical protein
MTNATITNEPISIQLNNSESVTVPAGETWEIIICCQTNDSNNHFEINGEAHIRVGASVNRPTQVVSTTVTGGDTLGTTSDSSANISGYVVDT